MPTYDYQCKRCDHKFEAFHSMTAKALAKCPQCGRRSLQRLIGAGAGIIFKGSGFYATDYKRGASSADKAGGSEPGSDRSDSKPSASESASTGSSSSDSSDSSD